LSYSLDNETLNYKTFEAKFENTEQSTSVSLTSSGSELSVGFQKNDVELTAQLDFGQSEREIELQDDLQEVPADLSTSDTALNGDFGAYQEFNVGGTSDHSRLINRSASNQHPISSIDGLKEELSKLQPAGAYITQEEDPTVPGWAKMTKPDDGLSQSGQAADAKMVGDKLEKINTTVGNIEIILQTI